MLSLPLPRLVGVWLTLTLTLSFWLCTLSPHSHSLILAVHPLTSLSLSHSLAVHPLTSLSLSGCAPSHLTLTLSLWLCTLSPHSHSLTLAVHPLTSLSLSHSLTLSLWLCTLSPHLTCAASSGFEGAEFNDSADLSNHMGLFLQKTNIIRDYLVGGWVGGSGSRGGGLGTTWWVGGRWPSGQGLPWREGGG